MDNFLPIRSDLRISVAMCTYNGERYVGEQLESILHQVVPVHEVVVSDDGSTDATLVIVQNFAKRAPFPVRLVRNEKRLGSTKNFEHAISLCLGNLIALADQDDVWFPQKTKTVSQLFGADPSLGAVFGNARLINANSMPIGKTLWQNYAFSSRAQAEVETGRFADVLIKRPVVTGATLIFRAELRAHILPIPEPWIHDAWIAWMVALHSRVACVSQPLMAYRVHAAQQIGVPTGAMQTLKTFNWTRIWHPSSRKRSMTLEAYRNQVAESQQLIDEARRLQLESPALLDELLVRKSFFEGVLDALAGSRLRRLIFSLRNQSQYARYSFTGWRAALRDVLL